jgi:hypothetical protein
MSSQCETVRDRFSAYWEKVLTPSEEAEIKDHLDSCPSCREEYNRFGQTLRMIHSLEEVEVPEGFLAGVVTKLDEGNERSPSPEVLPPLETRRLFSWRLPAEAIAMVTIVFLALFLTQNRSSEIPQKEATPLSQPSISDERKTKDGGASLETEDPKGRNRIAVPEPDPKARSAPEERIPKPVKKPVIREAGPLQKQDAVPAAPRAPAPPPERRAADRGLAAQFAPQAEKKEEGRLFREYILKSRNAEETSKKVLDLVKRFGGEILSSESGTILAALPGAVLVPFHEGLEELEKPPAGRNAFNVEKPPAGEVADSIGKRKELERKGGSPAADTGKSETVSVRIVVQVLSEGN